MDILVALGVELPLAKDIRDRLRIQNRVDRHLQRLDDAVSVSEISHVDRTTHLQHLLLSYYVQNERSKYTTDRRFLDSSYRR